MEGRHKKTSSGVVKVHKVTTGETFGADEGLLRQMTDGLHVKFTSPEESDVIIVFCPIISCGSDVEAAMRKVSDDKKIILVMMHNTRDVDYSIGGRRWSETFRNVVLDVDVLFHETVPGLLICDENRKAIRQIQDALAQYNNRVGSFDQWIPQSFGRRRPETQSESVSDSSSQAPLSVLGDPWRQISWGDNEKDLKYVKDYQPQNDEISHLRILLYGPVGAGKSSLINSVHSVVRERPAIPASVSGTSSDKSHTKKYETHKIQKEGRGNFYPFVFNDIMGLGEGGANGVNTHDIKLALEGHVKEGYKFNPVCPLSHGDPGYNSSPSPGDRVHVLVCVYSANASEVKSSVLEKMKEIREAASELGIPQLAVLTHIDEACGETEKSLRNVYKSKYLKKKMSDFRSKLGIPMNCILPVKNYSHEISSDEDVNTLILNALKLMIDFGDDFIINKL